MPGKPFYSSHKESQSFRIEEPFPSVQLPNGTSAFFIKGDGRVIRESSNSNDDAYLVIKNRETGQFDNVTPPFNRAIYDCDSAYLVCSDRSSRSRSSRAGVGLKTIQDCAQQTAEDRKGATVGNNIRYSRNPDRYLCVHQVTIPENVDSYTFLMVSTNPHNSTEMYEWSMEFKAKYIASKLEEPFEKLTAWFAEHPGFEVQGENLMNELRRVAQESFLEGRSEAAILAATQEFITDTVNVLNTMIDPDATEQAREVALQEYSDKHRQGFFSRCGDAIKDFFSHVKERIGIGRVGSSEGKQQQVTELKAKYDQRAHARNIRGRGTVEITEQVAPSSPRPGGSGSSD